MTGIVAGLGAKAMLRGALGGIGKFIRAIPWYVWLGVALAGLLAFLAISRSHWIDRARADEAQLSSLCAATRAASSNPKLDCRQDTAQIRLLGTAIGDLKSAIGSQNAHIRALAAATAAQQAAAADAERKAAAQAERALSASERLKASAALAPDPARPCKPSKVLEEQWR